MMTAHDPTVSRYADIDSEALRDALLNLNPKQRAALAALASLPAERARRSETPQGAWCWWSDEG